MRQILIASPGSSRRLSNGIVKSTGSVNGSDAPICQDGRSGGFTELLARAEVSHDALIDFPSEKAFKASDDVAFRPSMPCVG